MRVIPTQKLLHDKPVCGYLLLSKRWSIIFLGKSKGGYLGESTTSKDKLLNVWTEWRRDSMDSDAMISIIFLDKLYVRSYDKSSGFV